MTSSKCFTFPSFKCEETFYLYSIHLQVSILAMGKGARNLIRFYTQFYLQCIIQGQSTPLSLTAGICLQLCAYLPSPGIWIFSLMMDLIINCSDPDQSQRNRRPSVLSRLLFPGLITCFRSAFLPHAAGKMDSEHSTGELPLLTHRAMAHTLLNRNMYICHTVNKVLI